MDEHLPSVQHQYPCAPRHVEEAERVAYFAEASISDNTRRAYRSDWRQFETWCSVKGLTPLPADPSTVALFLSQEADVGRKASTIKRRMATISNAHELAGFPTPLLDRRVKSVWKGIARTLGSVPAKKKALALSDLKAIVTECGDDLVGRRDKALLLLAFSSAMRRSELVALNLEDVAIEGDTGIRLTIRASKTDQEGKGHAVGVPCGRHHTYCPVLALRAYLVAARIEKGPVFRACNRWGTLRAHRLTSQSVAQILKKRLAAIGLDPTEYGGHSLRSGFVSAAARAKVPEYAIARQSRHRSVSVLRGYIQGATLFVDNPASALDL